MRNVSLNDTRDIERFLFPLWVQLFWENSCLELLVMFVLLCTMVIIWTGFISNDTVVREKKIYRCPYNNIQKLCSTNLFRII